MHSACLPPCCSYLLNPLRELGKRLRHLCRGGAARCRGREENHLISTERKASLLRRGAKHALAPVATHGVAKPFGGYESNAAPSTLLDGTHGEPHESMVEPLTALKDLLKILFGLDGLHGHA